MGPLAGVKILELAGVGPGPLCAMLLADLGATVLRIDRPEPANLGIARPLRYNFMLRGRKTLAVDLKKPQAIELVLKLVARSDALIEGFRPGVMERLGLGPDACLKHNPKFVFGRITGWGQTGPLAKAAGHDLNYIALTGALDAFGRQGQPPAWPLNTLGDYAGGALYLALGVLSAIINARQTGHGQVVDTAIVDGVASLMTSFHGLLAQGGFNLERGTNLMDSGAPFYDVYECADGKWVSIGPLEAKFYEELLTLLGLDAAGLPPQMDRAGWPTIRAAIAATIKTKTRDAWCTVLEGTDACFAPVLNLEEAVRHPHMRARETYIDIDGLTQPAPAPRFSLTSPATPTPPAAPVSAASAAADEVLAPWFTSGELAQLHQSGLLGA